MAAAVAANTLLSKDGYFDLRAIGLVHGALFLLALYLLSTLLDDAPRVLRLATYGAVLFCFTDVMYVSYLNSFYMDVAAWLFLSIAAMLYLRWLRRRLAGLLRFQNRKPGHRAYLRARPCLLLVAAALREVEQD